MGVIINDGGLVMTTPDGFALTENYDFGNAFVADAETMVLKNFSLSDFTLSIFYNILNTVPVPQITFTMADGSAYDLFVYFTNLLRIFGNTPNGAGYEDFGHITYGTSFVNNVVVIYTGGNMTTYFNGLLVDSVPALALVGGNVTQIEMNSQATGASVLIGPVTLYDRVLGNDEIMYDFNNTSGNDPQNPTGLLSYIKPDRNCAALDISVAQDGSEIVPAFPNLISGKPSYAAKIAGLPAGLISTQTAYVNSNLIQRFVTGI